MSNLKPFSGGKDFGAGLAGAYPANETLIPHGHVTMFIRSLCCSANSILGLEFLFLEGMPVYPIGF
uniref:Uncharacterized protein n=1 Tax=Anguilla anguilla TaxID=7936 RepID=A0A0E9W6R5_ANGAN